jgi:hypothetical protein
MIEALARIQLVDELEEYSGDFRLIEWAMEKEIREEKKRLLSSGEVEWDMETALLAWEDKMAEVHEEMMAALAFLDELDEENWEEEDSLIADDELRMELSS